MQSPSPSNSDESKSTPSARFPATRRKKFTRSKTGCFSCRKRRKKCDGQVPVCRACIRNNLDCVWPDNPPTNELTVRDDPSTNVQSAGPSTPTAKEKIERSLILYRNACSQLSNSQALQLAQPSKLLLDHYISISGGSLTTEPVIDEPFLRIVLPMAESDDLILNAMLAFSGSHLNYDNGAVEEVQIAGAKHYGATLRTLQQEIFTTKQTSSYGLLRICLVMILLCHVEVLGGSAGGSIFAHLRGLRHLIFNCLQCDLSTATAEHSTMLGFVLETHAYLSLVSNVIPYGLLENRLLQIDFLVSDLTYLTDYETHGIFFDFGTELYQYILPVASFASRVLMEESQGTEESEDFWITYHELREGILSWKHPQDIEEEPDDRSTRFIAELYRNALLIFLETARSGSVVDDPEVLTEIQKRIDDIFCRFHIVCASRYQSITIWPLLIAASCLRQEGQRNYIRQRWQRPNRWQLNLIKTSLRILELLWQNPDDRAFGPYGMYLIMKEHDINLNVA